MVYQKSKLVIITILVLCTMLNSDQRNTIGDINNDGVINVQDIIRIVNIILQNDPPPTEYEQWAGDVNNDDNIDVTDIIIIVNYILGTGILCDEGYSFCPGSITECCADITSHEYIWDVQLLGDEGEINWLYDVAVVDDTSIYVVGYLTIEGQNYNFGHWDGESWDFQLVHVNWELRGIKYFSENDIWVMMGTPIHWDGTQWSNYHLWNMGVFDSEDCSVYKIWANDPDNIVFIGDCGTIAFYNGTEFIRMDSGTNDDLYSITGTDITNVWVSGHSLDNASFNTSLLHFDGTQWNQHINGILPNEPHPDMITGVIQGVYTDHPDSLWVKSAFGYYITDNGTEGDADNLSFGLDWEASTKYVQGATRNNVFMVGAWDTIWHYNGINFHLYSDISNSCSFKSVSVKSNIVTIVGNNLDTSQAIVIIGYN